MGGAAADEMCAVAEMLRAARRRVRVGVALARGVVGPGGGLDGETRLGVRGPGEGRFRFGGACGGRFVPGRRGSR
jgi:hypothetical protein